MKLNLLLFILGILCISIAIYHSSKRTVNLSVSDIIQLTGLLFSMVMIILMLVTIQGSNNSANKTIQAFKEEVTRQIDSYQSSSDRQIIAMQKIEEDKVLVAINSLIAEMTYNTGLILSYIEHAENGVNVTPGEAGDISYELNKPSFGAYERYLIIACKGNIDLAKEITGLYSQLEACKTTIEIILNFVATNAILSHASVDEQRYFIKQISYYNKNLTNLSRVIQGKIPDLINKLEALK